MYVGVQGSEFNLSCSTDCLSAGTGLFIDCQSTTMLSYFQLGNAASYYAPEPFLNAIPPEFQMPTLNIYGKPPLTMRGPLMTAAQAMFGNSSWLQMAGDIMELSSTLSEEDATTYLQLLCSRIPLGSATYFTASSRCGISDRYADLTSSGTNSLTAIVGGFFAVFTQPWLVP